MPERKPLNFAQAVRKTPTPSPEKSEPDSQLPTPSASQLSTTAESRIPPASPLPTTTPDTASKLAKPRAVDSRKAARVDSRKGDRHRKDKVPYNNRIGAATYKRIKHFIAERDLEQQAFAELSAIHFMDAVESHQADPSASKLAHDDRELMILFKTRPSIINLYLHYNPENRWKPADDFEGQRYNERDIRLIEVGIIQTQFNARFKKVNSFKYYTTEIDIALETPLADETIKVMLHHARRRWSAATGREAPE